ncbi:MAG: LysR family transcriptional regulator [Verrucomicrobia bacterium]|nr:LysR family transcriptional regulator [Verrucomicrobiota bacterium]
MNVHHLELFYYVAKHGGISAAVRHIPYGIQQPAVSGQMKQLEDTVGTKLFERSPFKLTNAGARLFAHVQPFFDDLDTVAQRLRAAAEPELRMGGAELALRHHIPRVMQRVKQRFPRLRFSLRSGFQTQLEDWLRDGLIDVAVTAVDARPPARLRQKRLTDVPLVLLVPRACKARTCDEIFAAKRIAEPLISVPASGVVSRNFQAGLKKRGVIWPQTVEATSIELVADYVANGDGFGVSIAISPIMRKREVRVLPLPGFTPMTIGAIWRGEPSLLVQALVDVVQGYAEETWPAWKASRDGG